MRPSNAPAVLIGLRRKSGGKPPHADIEAMNSRCDGQDGRRDEFG